MIISRSPLRISLGGGGTDLPSYYRKHEAFLISAAINKYVYVGIHKTFEKGFYLKYSNYERVQKVENIKHPIIKESIKSFSNFKVFRYDYLVIYKSDTTIFYTFI